MHDLKAGAINWIVVGLMAISFIVAMKFVVNRWSFPDSVKNFVNAV